MVSAGTAAFQEFRILTSGPADLPASRIALRSLRADTRPVGSTWPYRLAGRITRSGLRIMLTISRHIDSPTSEKRTQTR
jgi:hypothetical protein